VCSSDLLSKGYQPRQIISCLKILDVPIASLQNAVEELHTYSLASVSLDDCWRYATAGRLTVSRVHIRRMIANVLGCSAAQLPNILTKDNSIRVVQINDVRANLAFLHGEGFTQKQIISVPLVLLHSPEVLQRHWSAVTDPSSQSAVSVAYRRFAECAEKQLNVLQYAIEQSANFQHAAIVFADQVELRHLETVDNVDHEIGRKLSTSRSSSYSVGIDDEDLSDEEEISPSANNVL